MCGVTFVNQRIWAGNLAATNQYPWLAFVRTVYNLGSGTIIHPRWLLTACHLVLYCNTNEVLVIYGTTDLNNLRNVQQPTELICHEDWGGTYTYNNDLALIKVGKEFVFNPTIMQICIPSLNLKFPTIMEVAGWGQTEATNLSMQLRYTTIQVRSKNHCEKWWRGVYEAKTKICAGMETGVCHGDLGSSLISRKFGAYFLEGIFSVTHTKCGLPALPAIFTKVRHYLSWIKSKMKDDTFCQPLEP